MIKTQELKKMGKFAGWGAIGFGIGGAIGGAAMLSFDAPALVMPLFGTVGGAVLGLALKDWKRAVLLALAGAIGLLGGQMFAFSVGYFVVVEHGLLNSVSSLIPGTVMGVTVGVLLALVLKDWRGMWLLALAGAIGFNMAILGYQGIIRGSDLHMPYVLRLETQLAIWGIVGGAFLGAALGYLEKRKADRGGG